MDIYNDEPLSPAGRFFVQPATHQIINCILGLERPLGFDAVQTVISDSLMINHPRFSSLLITDTHGREYWRKTKLDINRHIITHPDPVGVGDTDEEVVNGYVADLTVSCPLTTDKPLWEIHLLLAHHCLVMRMHHALGDGVSLMSLMLSMFRKLGDPDRTPTVEQNSPTRRRKKLGTFDNIIKVLKVIWFSLIYVTEFVMRGLWVKDRKTVVRGGEGVELWPRKLVTAKFSLEDMKMVKRVVANATINDVLFGVISFGLSKYLDKRSPDSLEEGLQITGVTLVNLRPSPGLQDIKDLMKKNARTTGWGNKVGVMLLPVYYHKNKLDPLHYLKRAKMMMDRKKLSMEAFLSHQIGCFVMKLFGAKAITMHMMSYAGKADMQILVAKDLIPDPEKLAKCFEDALLKMKEYAIKAY